jgi:hypothetical protein
VFEPIQFRGQVAIALPVLRDSSLAAQIYEFFIPKYTAKTHDQPAQQQIDKYIRNSK